jgi:predicted nucleic acid-binding protein
MRAIGTEPGDGAQSPSQIGVEQGLLISLIAQACIDHEVRLVTREDDFLHFSRLGRLRLAISP